MASGLLVTSSFLPGRGGIESYLATLCELTAPELAVLAPPSRDDKPLPRDLPYPTFPLSRRVPLPDRRAVEDVVEAAREVGTKRILFGTPWPLVLIGPELKKRGLHYATIVHGAELVAPAALPLLRTRLARALGEADLVLAVSDFTRRRTAEFLRASGRRVPEMALLRARVDIGRFRCVPDRRVLRDDLGLPRDAKIVLCFGRLVPRKGTDRVIEAMSIVRKRVPSARLVIAGTGPEMRKLTRLAAEREEPVMFMGRVPDADAPKVYAAADAFALGVTDRWFGLEIEGLGVVLLEAGAACTPAVTGRSGGTPEAVLDGETGFVVDATNRDSLADRIAVLLEDEDLARRMGDKARAHVESTFSQQELPTLLSGWLGIQS